MSTETEIEAKSHDDNPWIRLLYLMLFAVIFNLTEFIIILIAIFQFISKLATGDSNIRLRSLGRGLGVYAAQIIEFMTYCSDEKPFPFKTWPSASPPRQ